MDIDVESFRQAFFDEAGELLADFEAGLLKLEENPNDRELLNTIFRCAHSIKGGSATFGFPEIAAFTHGLETLLDRLREGKISVTSSLCELLLKSLDQLRILVDAAMGLAVDVPDSTNLTKLIEVACGMDLKPVQADLEVTGRKSEDDCGSWSPSKKYRLRFYPGADVFKSGCDPSLYLRNLAEIADFVSITCDTSRLPALADLDPLTCYLGWEIDLLCEHDPEEILAVFEFIAEESEITLEMLDDEHLDEIAAETTATAGLSTTPGANSKAEAPSLRVSSEKVDRLINLVGELLINQSILSEVTRGFEMANLPSLLEAITQTERATRELQERIMGIRLVPVKQAFSRFPRLVRDLSAASQKRIELKMSGEETELDKSLIEAIGDPLTHLVRNSIDHGLESPEIRESAGKPPVGTLSISACHEGGSIVIEVADDGLGLNREKILAKAVERGLISSEESLTDEQIYNLIFLPGFSTADKVTDLSGRGVGMDIVKQSVTAIGGSIKVSSKPGEGVSTRIRLPLTMAILEGQSMSVGDSVYIVPLTSIIESLRPKEEDLHEVAHLGEVVTVRGEFIPIKRLYEVFNLDAQVTNPWEGSLVLVESEGQKVALMADDLIGQGQVVIKSLETNYRKVEGIAGATILGNGRVALIIDVPGLTRSGREQSSARQPAA